MENDALFSNTSKLDEEVAKEFNAFMGKKITVYAVLALIVICGVLGGLSCIFNLFLGIAIIGVGALIGAPLTAYLIKDSLKKQSANALGGGKFLVHFDFYDSNFKIMVEGCKKEENEYKYVGEEVVDYLSITKIVVTDTKIYLQRNNNQANIVDQRGMTHGTAGELIDLLKGKGLKVEKMSAGK